MNRAQRRAAKRDQAAREELFALCRHCLWPVELIPMEIVLHLNALHPVDGMAEVVYEIRRECGPDVLLGICWDCVSIAVVPLK